MEIIEMEEMLFSYYGDTGWWPGETLDEVLIGSILVQNTSWSNVEKSIKSLKDHALLSIRKLSLSRAEDIGPLIRSSGYYNQKAERLISVCSSIVGRYGSLSEMKKRPLSEVSEFLISLRGIGEETRDSILNYALDFPVFVVDKYTFRILNRTGIMTEGNIDDVKRIIHAAIGTDLFRIKNLHGMIVNLGKDFCKTKPECRKCPLMKRCLYASNSLTQ